MQFTVRLPRVAATALAIVVAAVAVAALLPATASSDTQLVVCIDPVTKAIVAADCGGTTVALNQQGVPGKDGAPGVAGPAGPRGPEGPAGPAVHLGKTRPALTAKIEAALAIQAATITGVNHDLRASLAATDALAPSTDPTIAALQAGVRVQGTSIARLVNVLRALTKVQTQLLQGLE